MLVIALRSASRGASGAVAMPTALVAVMAAGTMHLAVLVMPMEGAIEMATVGLPWTCP